MVSWICKININYENEFNKIIRFFVIETPLKKVSSRGISLKERKISSFNEINRKIKEISNPFYSLWEMLEENESIDEKLAMNEISNHMDHPLEYAFHKKQKNMLKTESLFYCIRCALAHGSFCIHIFDNEKYYYFENIHEDRNKVFLNGRMIIKENTLLSIIDYCNLNIIKNN